jgi:hypothetical protein
MTDEQKARMLEKRKRTQERLAMATAPAKARRLARQEALGAPEEKPKERAKRAQRKKAKAYDKRDGELARKLMSVASQAPPPITPVDVVPHTPDQIEAMKRLRAAERLMKGRRAASDLIEFGQLVMPLALGLMLALAPETVEMGRLGENRGWWAETAPLGTAEKGEAGVEIILAHLRAVLGVQQAAEKGPEP